MSNIYQTIANRNTEEATEFCFANGYNVENEYDIEMSLQELIANAEDKEAAFATIMGLHPDKETIVELYTTRSDFQCGPFTDCGQRLASIRQDVRQSYGDDGSKTGMKTPNLHPKILTSTNIIIAICAVAIVIAIAAKTKA